MKKMVEEALRSPEEKFLTFGSDLSLVPHLEYLIQLLIKGRIETADEKGNFFFFLSSNLDL